MWSLYEGFGLPALEAMHFGVPVIASSTGSLPEVVANAGVLVNPYAEGDIAGAIARLVHDAEFHAELSAKSLHRAAQFSWQQAAAETLKVFAEALASHEPKAYRHRVAEQRLG
jgi:glycosyltransferase involved in cell wall biosynthesis